MNAILFANDKIGELPTIANQIPKLTNIRMRGKASRNKIVLENIRDLFRVLFIRLFAFDRLDVFGMSENNVAGLLQNVVNGNSILSRGFHANVLTVVCGEPLSTKVKGFCERRKAFAFVGGNTLLVG